MSTTSLLYATAAAGEGLLGQPSAWADVTAATGGPDGAFATNTNARTPGYQRLLLSGYDPQAAILAATGGQVPYSLDHVHVQVTFSLDSATNYDSVDVLLLAADGTPLATRPLYLGDATTGVTVVAAVNFTGHTGYVDSQPLTWDELPGCQIALDVTRSGAAGVDTLRIDAVGLFVAYTVDPPVDPGEPEPHGGGVTLRAYDRDGRRLGQVPWSSLQRTIVRNEAGALTTQLPKSLLDPALLGDEVYLRVAEDGVEAPDYYLIDDDGDNDADAGGEARPVAIGATGAAAILEWGTVYSWEYQHGVTPNLLGLDPTYGFANATPGKILKTFIDLAKLRGCFPHLTYSFTEEVDSAGRGWTTQYARTYDVGTTIGKVLAAMAEDGWVDWEMAGFRLDVYMPDTALAEDYPDVILRLGKQVTGGPRKRTRKGARSVILANGAEGAMIEVSDPAALARLGRREGYEGRGGISDVGTLTAATQVSLQRASTASESITLEMNATEAPPLPRPGGYIRYDQRRLSPTQLEPMRVQSIAWDYAQPTRVSVELADLWVDQDVRLARRVDAILNGSSANERVPVQNPADRVPPAQVQGLALVSAPFEDPTTGQQYAQVTASWLEVTQDLDSSSIDELGGYTIEWRQPEVAPGTRQVPAGPGLTAVSWSPVVPGADVEARIAAYDRYTNYGPWSDWESVPAGVDETPPPTPTMPEAGNYLGLFRGYWDGGFVGGAGRPADLAAVEVHVSPLDGFDPNEDPEATRVGTMTVSGPVFTDTPYGAVRYVRLVAVDTTGNRSAPSAQASGATGPVVSADVFDGAIGSSKLADLAVITAKIADLAVNNAKIGSVEVGKVTAGVVNAEWIMGGRIATAMTGQRVELNSLGIFRWDADGNQTVAIDDNGVLLTGRYRTAITGRRVEIGAAGTTGELVFYSPSGGQQYLRSHSWARTNLGGSTTVETLTLSAGDTAWLAASTDGWVSLRGYSTNLVYRDGFRIWQATTSDLNGAMIDRFGVYPERTMLWGSGANGGIWGGGGSTDFSPNLAFHDNKLAGQAIRAVHNASGNRMELIWWDATAWTPWWASGFINQSDAATKNDIRPLDPAVSALSEVRRVKPKRYRRKLPSHPRPAEERRGAATKPVTPVFVDGPEEIGLIAQEAPEQIVVRHENGDVFGVDLYQMSTLLWAALTELADTVDNLKKGGKP